MNSWLNIVGRLRPSVSLEQAQAELRVIATTRAAQQTQFKDPSATLVPLNNAALQYDVDPTIPRISRLLFAMVLLVLIMATVVAAGLFLVRAEKRQKEIAIRLAIGASRFRLIRQLVLESFILSLVAAAGGFLVAQWSSAFLVAHAPESFPVPFESGTILLNDRVLLFTICCTIFSGVLFGLIPALSASAAAPAPSLKGEILAVDTPGRRLQLRSIFVIAQIALAVLLLTGAGLLLRTLWNASSINPGFSVENALVGTVNVSKHGYTNETGALFFQQFLASVKQIPEVRSAALARTVPVQNSGMRISIEVEGYKPLAEEDSHADFNIVTPGFFATLGVPIVYGRDFNESDSANASLVAIINQTMANKIWPGENPLGKILPNIGGPPGQHISSEQGRGAQIIAVVADVRYRNLREKPGSTIYVPLAQSYMSTMTLLVRTRNSTAIVPLIQHKLEELNPELPLFNIQTLKQKLGISLAQDRIVALLLGAFGGLALILAAVGLYTVISYSTQLRFREFGIRMAIGATKLNLLELVLAKGVSLAMLGVIIGGICSFTASRLIKNLLFGVRPTDPLTYTAIIALLFFVSLTASLIPAWKASRTEPTEALRYE